MNSKITLAKFALLLAEKSGKERRECEDILKSFFRRISDALLSGENVKVKGFGTFKISRVESRKSVDVTTGKEFEIPAHSKIVFIPAKEIAAAVNAPFEMFETVELEESLLEEELMQAEAAGDTFSAENIEGELILDEEKMDELQKKFDEYPNQDNSPEEKVAEPKPEEKAAKPKPEEKTNPAVAEVIEAAKAVVAPELNNTAETAEVEKSKAIETDTIEDHPRQRRRAFGNGFAWGIVATLLFIISGEVVVSILHPDFAGSLQNIFGNKAVTEMTLLANDSDKNSENEELADELAAEGNDMLEIEAGVPDAVTNNAVAQRESESAVNNKGNDKDNAAANANSKGSDDNVVPTKPSDAPEYDTITSTYFLGGMAKKHYGNYHFWPYIYKENEKRLGHPDRIRPGTRVVIPKLSKYGVNAKDPADIEKSKKLGVEIYSRYR